VAQEQPPSVPLLELSIVMRCLNEADTLVDCIEKAQRALSESAIAGEIVVADNGSTDQSRAIAERLVARVVTKRARWRSTFRELRFEEQFWDEHLGLYPRPVRWLVEDSLHFLARLRVA
jgi:GT2 family glycosyltransferase